MKSFLVIAAIAVTGALAQFDHNAFYDMCEADAPMRTCWGVPDGCVGSRDCLIAASEMKVAEGYEFQMLADWGSDPTKPFWIGSGFSRDMSMGEDTAILCDSSTSSARWFWNVAYTDSTKESVEVPAQPPFVGTPTVMVDDSVNALWCQVVREAAAVFEIPRVPTEVGSVVEENDFEAIPDPENNPDTYDDFWWFISSGYMLDSDPTVPDKHEAAGISPSSFEFPKLGQ